MGARKFEQRIDKRCLSMVNVRDYREISNIFSSFLIRHQLWAFSFIRF